MALLLSLGEKKAGTGFRGKNRNIYGGNRFRNIKKMAGTHFLIGIRNQNGKIGSKKGPEFGIPLEFAEFRSDFPTKMCLCCGKVILSVRKLKPQHPRITFFSESPAPSAVNLSSTTIFSHWIGSFGSLGSCRCSFNGGGGSLSLLLACEWR